VFRLDGGHGKEREMKVHKIVFLLWEYVEWLRRKDSALRQNVSSSLLPKLSPLDVPLDGYMYRLGRGCSGWW